MPHAHLDNDSHLDLGCGALARNPYGRRSLFGVDLRPLSATADPATEFRAANLPFEPIPYPDDRFASVSAFDFLEHVPRVSHGTEPNNKISRARRPYTVGATHAFTRRLMLRFGPFVPGLWDPAMALRAWPR